MIRSTRRALLVTILAAAAAWGQEADTAVELPVIHKRVVITATPLGPALVRPGSQAFRETLFTRDEFHRKFSLMTDLFLIDSSKQVVYIPDDGLMELADPRRSDEFEVKTSVKLTRRPGLDGGVTKVLNAYCRGTNPRVYVDRAPRFVANAALTLLGWNGWSGSLRMRAINHYRLDGLDTSFQAAGHTVLDVAL